MSPRRAARSVLGFVLPTVRRPHPPTTVDASRGGGVMPSAPVFMYHSVSPSSAPDPHLLRIHPERLDAQLRTLRRLGLRGVSVSTLLAALEKGTGHRLVGLTFDDGYTDFLRHAVPVLGRHGMTATVYVVAGRLAGQNDWEDRKSTRLNSS